MIIGKKIMCKNNSWKIWTRTSGEGWFWKSGTTWTGGWFENPRFWRTSFVDPKIKNLKSALNDHNILSSINNINHKPSYNRQN